MKAVRLHLSSRKYSMRPSNINFPLFDHKSYLIIPQLLHQFLPMSHCVASALKAPQNSMV